MRSNNMFREAAVMALAVLAAAACKGKDSRADAAATREIQLAPLPAAQPQLNDSPAVATAAPQKAAAPQKTSPPRKAPAPPPREEPAAAPPTLHVQVSPIAPRGTPAPTAADTAASVAASGAAAAPGASGSAGPAPAALGTVDAGTSFVVKTSVRICTNSHKPGDRFSTTLTSDVQGSNGALIPAGSPVVFRIVEASPSKSSPDSLHLVFDVVSVRVGDESYPVDGRVTQTAPLEKVRVQSTTDQVKKVGEGAAIGAIIGQIFGHNTRSTVVGGAVGAAAGGAVAAGTTTYDGCVAQLTPVSVTLTQPLRMKVAPAR